MGLDSQGKTGLGAGLAVVGAAGIVLSPMLGWTALNGPWAFVLGFLFGIAGGSGAALVIAGLWERRTRD